MCPGHVVTPGTRHQLVQLKAGTVPALAMTTVTRAPPRSWGNTEASQHTARHPQVPKLIEAVPRTIAGPHGEAKPERPDGGFGALA